ncbi:lectin-like domain-containing protein [Companilactobacillus ginsenosidimutans]|uniref:WxL domain-containing protein n=1 Tax=Companilactobacillus ginsenosidimutans TaxID=1007676 RepID=A0A0H4QK70_9LACO|nr:hypothetical protein [Companilactobacillus ginsenosidimutans]AKP68307.1 hypothetical protein ABM34_12670 [Companilactobacillus ginsenosidimutans]
MLSFFCYALISNTSDAKRTPGRVTNTEPAVFVKKDSEYDADAQDSAQPNDFRQAREKAPHGLAIDTLFEKGEYPSNTAKVIKPYQDNGLEFSILKVTSNTYQTGAIWSNVSKDNYIDVDKDQTLSMWLYLGNNGGVISYTGDGMAFVLQNDKKGVKAISKRNNGTVGTGQTLGVWGYDYNARKKLNREDIAKTAIQNSFAIEFDTFLNNGNVIDLDKGNSFDSGDDKHEEITREHIAMNYPDAPSTYTPISGMNNHFRMEHEQLRQIGMNNTKRMLSDKTWHHMTIHWHNKDENTGTLSYEFNDKNIVTRSVNKSGEIVSASMDVDINHFDLPHLDSKNVVRKLRWGFTGSTGQETENNLIVFESVPSMLNGNVSPSIYDDTQQKEVTSNDNQTFVGDQLSFKYELKYLSGQNSWNKNMATIDIPREVKYKSAEVIYSDGAREIIPAGAFDENASKLTYTLQNELNLQNSSATIVIRTESNNVYKDLHVGPAHAKFESPYLILDTDTESFNIKYNSIHIRTEPSEGKTFDSIQSIDDSNQIKVFVDKDNNTWMPKSHLVVNFNGKIDNIDISNLRKGVPYKIVLDKNKFHPGENTFEVYAVENASSQRSPKKVLKYYVKEQKDDLKLVFNKLVSFKPVNGGEQGQLVHRNKDWEIEVVDSRQSGNHWTLLAQATGLKNEHSGDSDLNGELVFIDDAGISHSLKGYQQIKAGPSVTSEVQSMDIQKLWSPNRGILLKLHGKNNPGHYHGKIDWCLTDSIN